MPQSTTPRPYNYITTPEGALTTPPGSPKILIHTRQGKVVGICCSQPAKILEIETQDSPKWASDPGHRGFLAVICPQTSVKVVGGQVTSVFHMLTMALDDPTMDDDLRTALAAHEIVLGDEWAPATHGFTRAWTAWPPTMSFIGR